MKHRARLSWTGFALLLALTVERAALGQTDQELAEAKELGQQGLALFDKGEYEAALDKLEAADQKAKIPPLGLFAARALARLDRLLEARARYEAVLDIPLPPNSPPVWQQAKVDAKDELEKLRAAIPKLSLTFVGVAASELATLAITLDGVPLAVTSGAAIPMNPGKHVVVARHDGREETAEVTLVKGAQESITLDLSKAAQSAAGGVSPLLVAGGVILGVGGLGLVTWGATGGAALAKAAEYGCEADVCESTDIGDLTALRTASTISFYAGGGLALTGAALMLISLATDSSSAETAWLPLFSPGVAGSPTFLGVARRF